MRILERLKRWRHNRNMTEEILDFKWALLYGGHKEQSAHSIKNLRNAKRYDYADLVKAFAQLNNPFEDLLITKDDVTWKPAKRGLDLFTGNMKTWDDFNKKWETEVKEAADKVKGLRYGIRAESYKPWYDFQPVPLHKLLLPVFSQESFYNLK
jgi:hypothetical protein